MANKYHGAPLWEKKLISTKSSNPQIAYTIWMAMTNKTYALYKIREKNFTEFSMKFYSDEKDKPFGLYSATIEAYIGSYVKK